MNLYTLLYLSIIVLPSPTFRHLYMLSFFVLSDLVAIPDFLAGAMENWGLITFRETTLLVGKNSSFLEKQVVASVIAHELAHQVCFCVCEKAQRSRMCLRSKCVSYIVLQWFGNLVTMRWWNDLWLNEGFATYMQYTSLQELFPHLDTVSIQIVQYCESRSHCGHLCHHMQYGSLFAG